MYRSETIFITDANDVKMRENVVSDKGLVLILGDEPDAILVYMDDTVWESVVTRMGNLMMAHYMGQMVPDDECPTCGSDDPTVRVATCAVGEYGDDASVFRSDPWHDDEWEPVGPVPRDFDPDWVEVDEDGVPVPNDDADYMKEILA